jgi:hypothetical protein
MTPLLFAAAVAGSTAFAAQPPSSQDAAKAAEAACQRMTAQTVAPNGVPFKKLNELPWGVLEHAVWRKVGGCPVREVVYKGQTYYVGSSLPTVDRSPAVEGRYTRKTDHLTPLSPDAR